MPEECYELPPQSAISSIEDPYNDPEIIDEVCIRLFCVMNGEQDKRKVHAMMGILLSNDEEVKRSARKSDEVKGTVRIIQMMSDLAVFGRAAKSNEDENISSNEFDELEIVFEEIYKR